MYKISEAIIVEGVYDKIKLSRFIDAVIFTTNGFQIFSNKNMLDTIKQIGEKTGIVILTDSDSAGFKIRNYLKQSLPDEKVKHAYIPNIHGKEKRKTMPGKEGLLGVEGINDDIIINALKKSGCHIEGYHNEYKKGKAITKAHLYADGFSGREDSADLRRKLALELSLPSRLSANMLIDVLNRILDYDEYCEIVKTINNNYTPYSK